MGCQHHPAPHLWSWSESETGRFGWLPPRSQCDLKSLLQGFRYTNVIFQGEAALDGTTIKVCIELRDVNYPGATYHLTYDQEGDQMASLVNGRC